MAAAARAQAAQEITSLDIKKITGNFNPTGCAGTSGHALHAAYWHYGWLGPSHRLAAWERQP